MRVRGLTKVRNEAHLIETTLDAWAPLCADGIHVFDDGSTDDTAAICQDHPAVVEVIQTDLYDPDRPRADMHNRQQVLSSALRFAPDWVAYFDADEHWFDLDTALLANPQVNAIAPMHWHDVYITPDDEDGDPLARDWVSADPRPIPLLFRNGPDLSFTYPDQRIMHHRPPVALSGRVRHYGLGWSVEQWERKCWYYGTEWPQYAAKWQRRHGQAVRHDYTSVKDTPLVRWSEIRKAV